MLCEQIRVGSNTTGAGGRFAWLAGYDRRVNPVRQDAVGDAAGVVDGDSAENAQGGASSGIQVGEVVIAKWAD